MSYLDKLNKIISILHDLLDPVVKFQKFVLRDIEDYDELITCLDLDKVSCKKKTHCLLREENGECQLLLPDVNLFSKSNNEIDYFRKLSDEIIRYSKIRKYLFTPRTFLSFEHVNYKINDDEIILLEGILLDKYLDNIKLRKDNTYIKSSRIYDLTNPDYGISYKSTYRIEDDDFTQHKLCTVVPQTMMSYNHATIQALFVDSIKNDNVNIDQYINSSNCCFEMIQFILQNSLSTKISINSIKEKLFEGYKRLKDIKIPEVLIKKGTPKHPFN